MRVFWGLIAALAVAAAAMFAVRGGDNDPAGEPVAQRAPVDDGGEAPAGATATLDTLLGLDDEAPREQTEVGNSPTSSADPAPAGAPGLVDDAPAAADASDDGARADAAPAGPNIPGAGTPEDPYRISWDLLVSAEQSFQPRLGKNELPEWAERLNGAHVKVTGYLGLPVFASEIDELLVMKNQWDGCCLGIPPTPYDAVEVQLAAKLRLRSFVDFGTVTGRLEIEPYVRNNWLLGLYVIREAQLETGG